MNYYYGLLAVLFFSACVKDKPQEPVKTAVSINADSKVLVINEGGYGNNNAGITLYDASSGAAIENYYQQQNGSSSMGDVCQSLTKYNNSYYIVMNHSNKIIVANSSDLMKTATISGFNSPRYLLPITYNKAYVSDLYQNAIQIVDLNTNAITGSIPCMAGTEEMVMLYNKAFITNSNSDYCYTVNTMTDLITDSTMVGKGGSSIVLDKNAKVWILTNGHTASSQTGHLVRLNPITLQVELNLNFTLADSPHHLRINKTRDTLYYLNKGIQQFLINSTQLPTSPLVSQGSKIYYGLGVNPKDYTIYVSDAIDYVQKSKIEIYSPSGVFKSSFNAGIISNGFLFE